MCLFIGSATAFSADYPMDADSICIPATIETQTGKSLALSLELAVTPQTTKQGLMFREFLAPLGGMIFVFYPPQDVAMWMKNTLIPLDMIYVSETGRVIKVHENAIPHDLTPLWAGAKTLYVIELRGGAARRFGIKQGDQLQIPKGILNFQ